MQCCNISRFHGKSALGELLKRSLGRSARLSQMHSRMPTPATDHQDLGPFLAQSSDDEMRSSCIAIEAMELL